MTDQLYYKMIYKIYNRNAISASVPAMVYNILHASKFQMITATEAQNNDSSKVQWY